MEAREQFIRRGMDRPEMLNSGGAEEQGKGHFELSIEEDWLRESPQSLPKKVQQLTKKLLEANEALRKELVEKRRREAASYDNETRYRNILETLEDGYFEVDLAGNLTFFNEALCRLTGYSREELHGMNNRVYTKPETARKMYEIFNRIYRTGEPSKIADYEVIKKDGTECVMELSTSLMRDSTGKPTGFRGIARDITGIRSLEKAKERAINHLSHELGTPLSIIDGVLKRIPDLMKSRNVERIHELIERMNRNVKRLRDLQSKVDDILNEMPLPPPSPPAS